MIEEIHVKVPVAIVIKKDGLGAEPREVKTVFGGLIAVCWDAVAVYALADQQLIVGGWESGQPAYFADVDVEESVVVDVHDGNTGGPAVILGNMGESGDIFEVKLTCVEIEFIAFLVGGEKKVDEAIVVKISGAYSSAIVIIHVIEYAECGCGMKSIAEVQAGGMLVERFKGSVLGMSG
jgi:hypothetical protein